MFGLSGVAACMASYFEGTGPILIEDSPKPILRRRRSKSRDGGCVRDPHNDDL